MHTLLILIHVGMMVTSLALMAVSLGLGLFGKKSAALVATFGELATVMGGLSGAILLLDAPLSLQCAMLTAYLVGVTALYWYGFGMGDAEEARFIRSAQ